MNARTLFSVIVASHGRSGLVEQLLASLQAARAAITADVEVLIVDSSSRPQAQVIRNACIKYGAEFLPGPLSVRRKRNIGARSATGKWLLFVDSDCEASPGLFAAYQECFTAKPQVCVAAGPTVFRGEQTTFVQLIKTSSLFAPFCAPAVQGALLWATTSNLLVRRDIFESFGGFREQYPFRLGGDDTDLCLRMRDKGHQLMAAPAALCYHSWSTWSKPAAVFRRSFRWGWMHALLLRDHLRYRRLDAPGLPVHFLFCLVIALAGALAGAPLMALAPVLFIVLAVVLHALLAAARAGNRLRALLEDLCLAFVELPFGFGRALGSLAGGSLLGLFYRLDADDAAMDSMFPETVRSQWSDHIALLGTAFFAGWLFR